MVCLAVAQTRDRVRAERATHGKIRGHQRRRGQHDEGCQHRTWVARVVGPFDYSSGGSRFNRP